ncbi:hypothetical protein PVAND_007459 [Polypedilum vanderplanki]|uniref:Uncharacterized protein n=1 Tax=Polypedilum vanderplanki TaxID=319348 RepID=A0A9J6C793_POLVA|nr:hypothetical protein PVAND_007459 [Polypedilum vanderplanki]
MRFIIFLATSCIFMSFASAMTLKEAYEHIHRELGLTLESMTLEWEYYTYHDEVSCFFVQDLAPLWYDAFQVVYADSDYLAVRDSFTNAGVNWDSFMSDEVEGAVGHLPYYKYPFHICTMNEHGGVSAMRAAVKAWWDDRRSHIATAVAYARANSPEYAAIYNSVSTNTQGAYNTRCSNEMKLVYSRMAEYEFDLNFFFDIFVVLFGMPVPANC